MKVRSLIALSVLALGSANAFAEPLDPQQKPKEKNPPSHVPPQHGSGYGTGSTSGKPGNPSKPEPRKPEPQKPAPQKPAPGSTTGNPRTSGRPAPAPGYTTGKPPGGKPPVNPPISGGNGHQPPKVVNHPGVGANHYQPPTQYHGTRDRDGNMHRQGHEKQIVVVNQRVNVVYNDTHSHTYINRDRVIVKKYYEADWDRREHLHHDYYNYWHHSWHDRCYDERGEWRWYARYHYYGGWYWTWHPYTWLEIDYYNPVFYWFYADSWDREYAYRYYGERDWDIRFETRYDYPGVFYATQEFRNLNFEVSEMSIHHQLEYREAMRKLARELRRMEFPYDPYASLLRNDIVITHADILNRDRGIVVEGFIAREERQMSFKAILDLDEGSRSMVFATSSYEPNDLEGAQIEILNNRIFELDPYYIVDSSQ